MTDVLSGSRSRPFRVASRDAFELSRKLDLIETRPDAVLTWADVADQARAVWRRLRRASR